MKIDDLMNYTRARHTLDARIKRAGQLEAITLLPVGLVVHPVADDKPDHVVGISWAGHRPRRFEHIRDGDLLPPAGGGFPPAEDGDVLPEPWWADLGQQQVHRVDDNANGGTPSLVIGRNILTELAMLEAVAAFTLLELRVRFQYARGDRDEWRDATLVGVGGKSGQLVYGLDHDRMKDGKPQLRSYKHGNIRGIVIPLARIPRWDSAWLKATP